MAADKKIVLVGYRNLKHKVSGESSKSLRESLKRYGDKIDFTYKYCPDLDESPEAINAAKAVVAAEKQGRGEDVYQALTNSKEEYSESMAKGIADGLGLDMPQFAKDFDSEATMARIRQDIEDSKTCGLHVFPGLTIDGDPYNGAWDDDSLFAAIDGRGGKPIKHAIESFFHWGASAAAVRETSGSSWACSSLAVGGDRHRGVDGQQEGSLRWC